MQRALFLFLSVLMLGLGADGPRAAALVTYRPPKDCARYLPASTCANWVLAPWLPSYTFASDLWAAGRARRIGRRDGFVYERERELPGVPLGFIGPDDGTPFTYGTAGPPRGEVVYDYAHRIAFYRRGCCSWNEVVAAYAPPPPKRVIDRNLAALHTTRGIHLGMSPAQVRKIYGVAPMLAVPGTPAVRVLAYTTRPPRKSLKMVSSPCGQDENFYFRRARLVQIQIGNGC